MGFLFMRRRGLDVFDVFRVSMSGFPLELGPTSGIVNETFFPIQLPTDLFFFWPLTKLADRAAGKT